MATHELHSSPETCHWGYFDSQLKPSLRIKSGDIATIHCVSGSAEILPGEPFNVLPSPIHLTVGVRDVLVLTNDDDAIHQVGPIILGSRQTYRIPFRRPGNFQYACSLHAAGTLTLVIAPAPAAGLDRLRWRLDQLIARS